MLHKVNRLTEDYAFRKVRKYGSVVHTPFFVLSYLSTTSSAVRVGFIASSKVGGSVERNRAVRVLREAVRQVLPEIRPGCDIVIIAKKQLLSSKCADVVPVLRKALTRFME